MTKTAGAFVAVTIIVLDVLIWKGILFGVSGRFNEASAAVVHDYFLDVGQGDGELIVFPGDVKVMTDAGPDDTVLGSLAKVLPQDDRYIDLAIISHPQLDHFNGYNFMLDHYDVGAFIYNGRDDDPGVKAWPALKAKIREEHIPLITLGAGDTIFVNGGEGGTSSSHNGEIDLLSPDRTFAQSAELNDTGFIELIKSSGIRTLLTADTGFNVENWLLEQHADIRADVLKVGHHGSKFSSGDAFLQAVDPRVAAIEVGAHNTYGHPGSSTLARLASDTDALVLRTDRNGTIEVWPEDGKIRIATEK